MLKKIIVQYKLKKRLASPLQSGKNNNKVLFLVNVDEFDLESIHEKFQELFQDKYAVRSIAFTQHKKKYKEQPDHFFHTKDFSFFGEISADKMKSIIQKKYEYVFQFFNQEHLYLNYISSNSKANLRVGFEDAHSQLTDLFLNANKNDMLLFFEEAKKYLEIIKKSA